MADHKRTLLRPEDASSWEEFQARSTVEQAQCRAATSSWRDIGLSVLSAFFILIAIFFWYVVATTPGPARWMGLVFALITTGVVVWALGKVMRRGVRGSRRYVQLDRLREEWHARAERGEIPQTTPGGPKVWQDEAEAEATGR